MNPDRSRVLIAEDDAAARTYLAHNLAADGYTTAVAHDADTALHLLVTRFDALVLDVNGRTLDVIDTVRHGARRRVDPQLPIIALTSTTDEHHRIRLIDRGADDVLSKPYFYPELRARLGAVLRRASARRSPQIVTAGPLQLDVPARRVWLDGVALAPLPDTQWRLLVILASDPPRAFTRQELIRSLWGAQAAVTQSRSRTLDSHAARLRRHLRTGEERFVFAVWGVGFRLIRRAGVRVHRGGRRPGARVRRVHRARARRTAAHGSWRVSGVVQAGDRPHRPRPRGEARRPRAGPQSATHPSRPPGCRRIRSPSPASKRATCTPFGVAVQSSSRQTEQHS